MLIQTPYTVSYARYLLENVINKEGTQAAKYLLRLLINVDWTFHLTSILQIYPTSGDL